MLMHKHPLRNLEVEVNSPANFNYAHILRHVRNMFHPSFPIPLLPVLCLESNNACFISNKHALRGLTKGRDGEDESCDVSTAAVVRVRSPHSEP